MDAFVIHGGRRLRGRVKVHGAKNAALPLMAAAMLADEPVTLRDVPNLADIRNMGRLLEVMGMDVQRGEDAALRLGVGDIDRCEAPYDIVRTMRASICVLGPALARRGRARVSMPGGCNIGDRPVDLHLRGLRALGAEIELEAGYIVATAERLRGARVFLGGPFGSTVLGTANVMSAAALAEGTTIIESAACEPEVADLAAMLNAMGARIRGAGGPRIVIEGVERLGGVDHTLIPDRIEAGTYIMAAAITNGDVIIDNCPTECLTAVIDRLEEIGVHIEPLGRDGGSPAAGSTAGLSAASPGGRTALELDPARAPAGAQDVADRQSVHVSSNRRLEPVQVVTQPYPGFPTDLQAQIMALLCMADGNSIITEKIFPDRFLHVAELLRMGARCLRNGPSVLVSGVRHLEGAPVMASDLRASAGLVLAGLAARGTTTVNRVYHLDRGYERMELTLQSLGAQIERIDLPAT